MENKKRNILGTVMAVSLGVIAIVAIGFAINMMQMRKKLLKLAEGSFVYKDGVETYMEHGQVVIDKLVNVDGKVYYVDGNGHKVKDTWAIIDNDGHYGYFGNFGDLIIDKIRTINGKDYYFDENGVLYQDRTEKQIKVIDGVEYVANKNGELRLAADETIELETTTVEQTTAAQTTIAQTTVAQTSNTQKSPTISAADLAIQQSILASQQAAAQAIVAKQATLQSTTQVTQQVVEQTQAQVSTEAPFANAIDISGNMVPDEFGGPGVVGNNNNASKTNNTVVSHGGNTTNNTNDTNNTNTQTATEVKIQSTQKVTDTVEGDDYDCNITLLKPIMVGTSSEETANMNSSVEELMDVWLEDIQSIVGEYENLPKSVTFTSATISSQSKKRVIITFTGNIKPKSGSSKSIKYKLTYDREEANGDIAKTSS